MHTTNWPILITAGPAVAELSGAELRFCKFEGSLYPWVSAPNKVEIETPLAKFWASSAKGKARRYFDSKGCPSVGVSVFFAIESGDRTERLRALRLLRTEDPNFVREYDGELLKIESDEDAFNGCVKEWLFARARAKKLSETNAEMVIATKRFEDTSRPRFRTWTTSNRHDAEEGYTLPEQIFFEALNRAILAAEGIPFLSEVRCKYEEIGVFHKEQHLAKERALKAKTNQETVTLEELSAQGSIRDLNVRAFDKVFKEMGFGWLPKERQMKELRENIRFYRLNTEA